MLMGDAKDKKQLRRLLAASYTRCLFFRCIPCG